MGIDRQPVRRAAAACAVAVTALLAAGCGDDSDRGRQPTSQPSATIEPVPGG